MYLSIYLSIYVSGSLSPSLRLLTKFPETGMAPPVSGLKGRPPIGKTLAGIRELPMAPRLRYGTGFGGSLNQWSFSLVWDIILCPIQLCGHTGNLTNIPDQIEAASLSRTHDSRLASIPAAASAGITCAFPCGSSRKRCCAWQGKDLNMWRLKGNYRLNTRKCFLKQTPCQEPYRQRWAHDLNARNPQPTAGK